MPMVCRFKCHQCGAEDSVAVPPRPNAEVSSLIPWIHTVSNAVGEYHRLVSPSCQSMTVDLALPITDNGIGLEGRPLTPEEQSQFVEAVKNMSPPKGNPPS